jgi:regulatory Fis family protein
MFRDSQRALILQTLQATGWMIGGPAGAAAQLGLKRTTLIAKMKKLGISRPVRHKIIEFGEHRESELGNQQLNEIPLTNLTRRNTTKRPHTSSPAIDC